MVVFDSRLDTSGMSLAQLPRAGSLGFSEFRQADLKLTIPSHHLLSMTEHMGLLLGCLLHLILRYLVLYLSFQ